MRIRAIGLSLFAGISTCVVRSQSSLISIFKYLFPWRFQNMNNQVFGLPFSQVFPYVYSLSSDQIANRKPFFHDLQWLYNIMKGPLNNRKTCHLHMSTWWNKPVHLVGVANTRYHWLCWNKQRHLVSSAEMRYNLLIITEIGNAE